MHSIYFNNKKYKNKVVEHYFWTLDFIKPNKNDNINDLVYN
jgi:hypothetical protein